MKRATAFVIVSLVLSSCGYKNINKEVNSIQGTYKGHFIRSSPFARYASSNVTITFAEGKFLGESDKQNYPAICQGTFNVNGKNIEFINECMWTADFDWSYILKDKFEFSLVDGKLEMNRSIGDNTDHYSLTLQ